MKLKFEKCFSKILNIFLVFVKNVNTTPMEYTVKNVLVVSFKILHFQTKMENQISTILIFVNVSFIFKREQTYFWSRIYMYVVRMYLCIPQILEIKVSKYPNNLVFSYPKKPTKFFTFFWPIL